MSDKGVFDEGFTQVDNKLIKHKELDCIEKMMLINFISYGDNIYPSITRICEELNISRPTCVKKINRLKEIGYLKVTKNKSLSGDYDNNSYEVVKKFNYVVKEINHGSKNNLPQVVKEINSNNTNKTILNNNIYTSSSEEEDSKKYVNEIDKELEDDLLNKIKSKYSKELIKDELDKLKDKGLSELDLLKELDKNLKANKKELENNKIKNKSKDKKYLEDSKEYKLSVLLRDLILERDNNSRCKNANMQSWSKHIDLLHRKDNRSYEDIENIIKWCQQDSFWKTNILSTQKLRDKFDMLYQKASIITKDTQKSIKKQVEEDNFDY